MSDLLPTATMADTRRVAFALIKERRWVALAALLVLIAGATAGLMAPIALGWIVDAVTENRGASAITGPVLVLATVAVAQAVFTAVGGVLVSRVGEPALAQLRERVLARALQIPLARIEAGGTGDLISRVTGDSAVVAEGVRGVIPAFGTSALTIAMTVGALATLSWEFALAGLVAVPIQYATLRWYLRRSAPIYAQERILEGTRAQKLLETIGGAATVRAFRLGDRHAAAVERSSLAAVEVAISATRVQTKFFARLNVAECLGLGSILVVGYFLVRNGSASLGEATAAALLFARLFDPINTVLALFDELQSAGAGLARLVGVLEVPIPKDVSVGDQPSDGRVQVTAVEYSYRTDHPVLQGVSLTIPAGQRVAVVGTSGAGKSTLAKIIAGVQDADGGSVTIGGADLTDLGRTGAAQTVALVTQEVHVFAGTLREDLQLAAPGVSDETLWAALDLVGAAAWVRGLSAGLDTVVGDGGHRVTATQAQQIALARLVLADRPVVILDEATAEAGSAGARVLDTGAENALRGRTSVVVAHRLSQAASADQIVVMDHGRIVEQGTHDDLVALGGAYATLWLAWNSFRSRE